MGKRYPFKTKILNLIIITENLKQKTSAYSTRIKIRKNKLTQTSGNRRTVSSVHISTVPTSGVKMGTLTTIITIRNRMPNRDVLDG